MKEMWRRESSEAGKKIGLELTREETTKALDLCECDFSEDEGPGHEEFAKHQNHEFWAWCRVEQGWYHIEEETGEIIWAPDEFD
jgi:broad specificity phosphatase PhoE